MCQLARLAAVVALSHCHLQSGNRCGMWRESVQPLFIPSQKKSFA